MKKQLTAATALLLTLSLFGCAQAAPTPVQTETPTTASAETTAASQTGDPAALLSLIHI